jgi:hypothetical protein
LVGHGEKQIIQYTIPTQNYLGENSQSKIV